MQVSNFVVGVIERWKVNEMKEGKVSSSSRECLITITWNFVIKLLSCHSHSRVFTICIQAFFPHSLCQRKELRANIMLKCTKGQLFFSQFSILKRWPMCKCYHLVLKRKKKIPFSSTFIQFCEENQNNLKGGKIS